MMSSRADALIDVSVVANYMRPFAGIQHAAVRAAKGTGAGRGRTPLIRASWESIRSKALLAAFGPPAITELTALGHAWPWDYFGSKDGALLSLRLGVKRRGPWLTWEQTEASAPASGR